MAATASPYSVGACTGPMTANLELSATPGDRLEVVLPQNARRMEVSLHNTSHHATFLAYTASGTGVPIAASGSITLPRLTADQRIFLYSAHASPTFTLHCALRD